MNGPPPLLLRAFLPCAATLLCVVVASLLAQLLLLRGVVQCIQMLPWSSSSPSLPRRRTSGRRLTKYDSHGGLRRRIRGLVSLGMRSLALILAFVMCPGTLELVRDAAHFVVEGHALHSAAPSADEHSPSSHKDQEHHCSGTFHACGCHVPPSFVMSRPGDDVDHPIVVASGSRAVAAGGLRLVDGAPSSLLRPPIG